MVLFLAQQNHERVQIQILEKNEVTKKGSTVGYSQSKHPGASESIGDRES